MKITKELTLPGRDTTRSKAKNLLIENLPKAIIDGISLEKYLETHKSLNNSQIKDLSKDIKDKKTKTLLNSYIDILETYAILDYVIGSIDKVSSVYCRNCKNGQGSCNCVENKNRFQAYYQISSKHIALYNKEFSK